MKKINNNPVFTSNVLQTLPEKLISIKVDNFNKKIIIHFVAKHGSSKVECRINKFEHRNNGWSVRKRKKFILEIDVLHDIDTTNELKLFEIVIDAIEVSKVKNPAPLQREPSSVFNSFFSEKNPYNNKLEIYINMKEKDKKDKTNRQAGSGVTASDPEEGGPLTDKQ